MTDSLFIGLSDQDAPQSLVLKRANRHGLIAGATGTGKTVTLQGLAEGFARAGVPVFLAHGRSDAMVAMARGTAARDSLTALGYGVEWQDYPMEHSVCIEEVGALNHWLQRVWAR